MPPRKKSVEKTVKSKSASSHKTSDKSQETSSKTTDSKPELPKEFVADSNECKKDSHHEGGCAWGLFLIATGIVLLLNTTGVLPWSIWELLIRFWPVLFVVWGLEYLFGRGWAGRLISGFIVFCLLGAIIVVAITAAGIRLGMKVPEWFSNFSKKITSSTGAEQSQRLVVDAAKYGSEGLEQRNVDINVGAGHFSLEDNDSEDYFVADSSYYDNFGKPKLEDSLSGNNLKISFDTQEKFVFLGVMTKSPEYDFILGQPSLKTKTTIDLGAGSGEVYLKKVKLDSLSAEVGAGRLDVRLGEDVFPVDSVKFDIGAGRVRLTLPENIGVKVNYDIGAGSVTLDGNKFSGVGQKGEDYRSNNYDGSNVRVEITVEVGAGSFELVRR